MTPSTFDQRRTVLLHLRNHLSLLSAALKDVDLQASPETFRAHDYAVCPSPRGTLMLFVSFEGDEW
jgi:hypothetical protein